MVLRIVKYGDPVLEQVAQPIAEFGTPELKQLVEDMFETMYANKGIGLAAPQVALSQRLTVIDPSAGEDPNARIVLINPEIVSKQGSQIGEEGCLSIPGFREDVKRFNKVTVRARNVDGESFDIDGEELLARAMQHEIDHLNGVLFLSHLSLLKRDLIRRKIRKLAKAGEWE
ncbi:peptide deformylase [Paludibaculum fermentans]|uniref:Peptide deformylase n=1 Tax=Paludibaculum fermentans TaxID=1473598 RepID=A0A7S7SKF5_PALFE|nr:peptide deformylase [Paludibaculum fermentans]QOY88269.1 peptide deformylase [Paludibaculum fermentans]